MRDYFREWVKEIFRFLETELSNQTIHLFEPLQELVKQCVELVISWQEFNETLHSFFVFLKKEFSQQRHRGKMLSLFIIIL